MDDLTFALSVALTAVVVAAVWVLLCRRGVIPDPVAKWSLVIAGAVVPLGLLPLVRVLLGGKETKKQVVIVETTSPGDEEIEGIDHEIDRVIAEGDRTVEALEEIDKAEDISRTLGDVDPDAGSIAADRLRRLRERSE